MTADLSMCGGRRAARGYAGQDMRGWTLLFAALTGVLSVALALQLRENRRLRDELVALAAAKARAAGIESGQALGPFTVRDAAGRDIRVDFAGVDAGTVLLFHSSNCDACAWLIARLRPPLDSTK